MHAAIRREKEDRMIEWQPFCLISFMYITVIRIAEGFILFSHPITCKQQGIFILCLGEYIPFL